MRRHTNPRVRSRICFAYFTSGSFTSGGKIKRLDMDKDAVLVNLSGVEVFVSLSSHVFDPRADEAHIRVLWRLSPGVRRNDSAPSCHRDER